MARNYTNKNADLWYEKVTSNLKLFPSTFIYDNVKYKGFDEKFFKVVDVKIEKEGEKESKIFTLSFVDDIEIQLVVRHYYSHGVTEWILHFENKGDKNTKRIKELCIEYEVEGKYPNLKGILGDHVNRYKPYTFDLSNNLLEFTSHTGQTSHNYFPYFNLECGDGGVMFAIGWAGTWNARFISDGHKTTYTANAVIGMDLFLQPGEKIRSALFVIAPYTERNEYYSTNYWRSWFVEYNLPKDDKSGVTVKPLTNINLSLDTGLPHSDGSISERYFTWKPSMDKLFEENLHFDFRWVDAGWSIAPDGGSAIPREPGHDWWDTIGTWEMDPEKWPDKSFLELTDYHRAHNMRTLLWFEPERVTMVDDLVKNYGYKREWAVEVEGMRGICNNIGNPECLKWTTDRICKVLKENKIELYREDHNFKSGYLWAIMDEREGLGRKGFTEIGVVCAHYKLWDDIIACTLSFGGCGFIDSCASGGGRNDLESLRRSVPLLRSDSDRKYIARRLSITTAFNKWIPFNGAGSIGDNQSNAGWGIGATDKYTVRASYLPSLHVSTLQPTKKPDTDFEIYRFALNEWAKLKDYLLKEFYVFTPWHREPDLREHAGVDANEFTAFAYYDEEKGKGCLLAFREEICQKATHSISLSCIEKGAKFRLIDEDTKEEIIVDGIVDLYFDKPRTARLLWIEKI